MDCPKGKILKNGYKTKESDKRKSYKVKPTCIKDLGKTGKGSKKFTIPDVGLLENYGYTLSESSEKRHLSLKKTLKDNTPLSIFRRLNAFATLVKNTNLSNYRKFIKDRDYIKMKFME